MENFYVILERLQQISKQILDAENILGKKKYVVLSSLILSGIESIDDLNSAAETPEQVRLANDIKTLAPNRIELLVLLNRLSYRHNTTSTLSQYSPQMRALIIQYQNPQAFDVFIKDIKGKHELIMSAIKAQRYLASS